MQGIDDDLSDQIYDREGEVDKDLGTPAFDTECLEVSEKLLEALRLANVKISATASPTYFALLCTNMLTRGYLTAKIMLEQSPESFVPGNEKADLAASLIYAGCLCQPRDMLDMIMRKLPGLSEFYKASLAIASWLAEGPAPNASDYELFVRSMLSGEDIFCDHHYTTQEFLTSTPSAIIANNKKPELMRFVAEQSSASKKAKSAKLKPSEILAMKTARPKDPEPAASVPEINHVSEQPSEKSLTLLDFFARMKEMVEEGMAAGSLDHAEKLEAFVTEHMPHLREKYGIDHKAIEQAIHDIVETFIERGKQADLELFQDPEFVHLMRNTWLHAIDNLLTSTTSPECLNAIDRAHHDAAKAVRHERDELSNTVKALDAEIAATEVRQQSTTSFKEKTQLRQVLNDLRTDLTASQNALVTNQDSWATRLLPEGVTLETLVEEAVALRTSTYTPEGLEALGRFTQAFDATPSDDVSSVETAQPPAPVMDPVQLPLSEEVLPITIEPVATQPIPVAPEPAPISVTAPTGATVPAPAEAPEAIPDQAKPAEEAMGPLTSYTKDLDLLHAQLMQHVRPGSEVSGLLIDNLAIAAIGHKVLPLAAHVLAVAEPLPVDRMILPHQLVTAAYLGSHAWKSDAGSVTKMLHNLQQISISEIGSWREHCDAGRMVPSLVFAATFQPSLFAGNLTNAPRMLDAVADTFPGPVQRLIQEVVTFTGRGNKLDVDALGQQSATKDAAFLANINRRLTELVDRASNKQTGWAPARQGMHEFLNDAEFQEIVGIITRKQASSLPVVSGFAERYRNESDRHDLMTRWVFSNSRTGDIAGHARSWFMRTLSEMFTIIDEWVAFHVVHADKEAGVFSKRLMTMIPQALAHLDDQAPTLTEFDLYAANRLVHASLLNVVLRAEGKVQSWPGSRIMGWLTWPNMMMTSEGIEGAEDQIILASKILTDGPDFKAMSAEALHKERFSQAMLLALEAHDRDGSASELIESIERAFDESRHAANARCVNLMGMLDNAREASLIQPEQHYYLNGEVEHIQDELKVHSVTDDLGDILGTLAELERDITIKFDFKTSELREQLETKIRDARIRHGADFVPAIWVNQVNKALSDHDTNVAQELLEHLTQAMEDGSEFANYDTSTSNTLGIFLDNEQELYGALKGLLNPREVGHALPEKTDHGLDFSHIGHAFKEGMSALLHHRGHIKTLNQDVWSSAVAVLRGIGLDVMGAGPVKGVPLDSFGFAVNNKFTSFNVNIKATDTGRGIVFFGENNEGERVTVTIAASDWSLVDLRHSLESKTTSRRIFMISTRALSNEERNAFASLCKRQQVTIHLIDMVTLAVLAGIQPTPQNVFRTYLEIALPWTYANPYSGDKMQPAPPEMRYGRSRDVQKLAAMQNGAAMIFGGRQLGKTTILKEVQRAVHRPSQGHFAYMDQMDGDLDRANLSGNELEKHRRKVWTRIYKDAETSKLVKPVPSSTSVEDMISALKSYFQGPGSETLLICLDEIDPILGLDAANGFRIFREISGLVNTSRNRFKVIIAGLENVRRFADAPNYPLHQLGSAIQVSIMSAAEAHLLVREPLRILGYEFESSILVNRILVATNRHPGLLQIFCHELLLNMANRHQANVGSIKITADDVNTVRNNARVHKLITERFDITLNLDLRYKLIAYSLIAQSSTNFTASRAKSISEEWAPECFRSMTEGQFEAFLDELCGLGVLTKNLRQEGGTEYALRNANITNLVGGPQKVEEKLLQALNDLVDIDPMAGHAFPDSISRMSPLTLRDEKTLIFEDGTVDGTSEVYAKSSRYSVGIIAGSEALGLKTQWLEQTLPAIGAEEPAILGPMPMRYEHFTRKDTDFASLVEFRRSLSDSLISVKARKAPIMLFVEVTGKKPLSNFIDMLDIAHDARLEVAQQQHRVRVIFLMGPAALWQWVSSPDTVGRETEQPFIALDLWKRTALVHLINKLQLDGTDSSVSLLESYSSGWYFSLDYLLEAKKQKPNVARVDSYGALYSPLTHAKPKAQEEFLAKTGTTLMPWVPKLLMALSHIGDHFDGDLIELTMEELGIHEDPKAVEKWLSLLRLIIPFNQRQRVRNSMYAVNPSVLNALAITHKASEVVA